MGEETSKGPELRTTTGEQYERTRKSCFHDTLKHRTTASRDNVGRMQRHGECRATPGNCRSWGQASSEQEMAENTEDVSMTEGLSAFQDQKEWGRHEVSVGRRTV